MENLAALKCKPCRGGDSPLSDAEIDELSLRLPEWQFIEREGVRRLERIFKFKNFAQALAFANQVGEVAESEDHHPAMLVTWGMVAVSWYTYAIQGLHRNDFIMAAKTDLLYQG